MTTMTSRAAAYILAAGLFACLGTPSFATEPSPWPATTGVTSTDSAQAAPNTDSDQAATAQPDAADRSPTADQRPADAMTEANDPNATQVTATSEEGGGGWDKASLVGKIFIAAGTLLTLGSAARMFMI
jgi:hypothetical protein